MNILLLSPYPPFPPHGGGTMRIYQIARGLAARHAVTCLTFAPNEAAEQALAPLHTVCRVLVVRGPEPRSLAQRAWTTLVSPQPDMALRNQSDRYTAALHNLLAHEHFDVVQAESIEMAPYLMSIEHEQNLERKTQPAKLVLDQFNAEYVIQKRAAQAGADALRRGQWLPRHVAGTAYSAAQWLKLAHFERQVMSKCDLVLAVSAEDRQTLLGLTPGANVGVVPNGVDATSFSRVALVEERVGLGFAPHTIVFSGTLDYRPNVDAVTWFVGNVLPLIRARVPDARLVVVGKRPAPALHALPTDAVSIVGEVPDARPWIAGAAVYVVPMRIGGGVRLKLLEALALQAPVVSTTVGAEGVVGLRHDTHCLLADSAAQFAEAVLQLFGDPSHGARLGAAGRALIEQRYDWQTIIPQLDALYRQL